MFAGAVPLKAEWKEWKIDGFLSKMNDRIDTRWMNKCLEVVSH